MECKVPNSSRTSSMQYGFNRDIVECKVKSYQENGYFLSSDLIETLWNVKYIDMRSKSTISRFNRDIVECKVPLLLSILHPDIDLIETLWNVKLSAKIILLLEQFDLIETLWNVKDRGSSRKGKNDDGFNRDIVECKVRRRSGTGLDRIGI